MAQEVSGNTRLPRTWNVVGIDIGESLLFDRLLDWAWDAIGNLATTRAYQLWRDGMNDSAYSVARFWRSFNKDTYYDQYHSDSKVRAAKSRQAKERKRSRVELATAEECTLPRAFAYSPLQQDDGLRLLRLLPGQARDMIECELFDSDRDSSMVAEYEALSYTWGANIPHSIACNGASLSISENLWLALQRIRQPDAIRTLWVDAVSINQADLLEKTQQVRRMRRTYMEAAAVIVWLGEATEVEDAFDLIANLSTSWQREAAMNGAMSPADLSRLNYPGVDDLVWKTLDTIFWRDWYFRVWVLQEVCVSKQITLLCGSCSMDFEALIQAVLLCQGRSFTTLVGIDPSPVRHVVEMRTWATGLGTTITQHESATSSAKILLAALLRGRESSATDPRDKVFALLGLVQTVGTTFYIQPDYAKSAEDVFAEVTTKHISTLQDLDILSAVEDCLARRFLKLPSWVANWASKPHCTALHMLPEFSGWHAAGSTEASPNIALFKEGALQIRGCIIDECVNVADSFMDNLPIPNIIMLNRRAFANWAHAGMRKRRWRQWIAFARALGESYSTGESTTEALARTIIAGQQMRCPSPGKDEVVESYKQYLSWCRKVEESPTYEELPHLAAGEFSSGEIEQISRYMEKLAKAAFGRRFFTTKKGKMGLCRPDVRSGYKIVLLTGGKTPYVLKAKRFGGQQWEFVGECYLHGCMHGEMMKSDNGKTFANERWFDIV
ncbi:Folylpolyglutamate synthetase [Elasticomyces elasticus]|nr:Folylpolyglutamate synthetase [Elasticomyces elasticus]